MVNLFLVQHGPALSKNEDPGRPLSNTAIEAVQKIGKFLMSSFQVKSEVIYHSPKLHAKQTATTLNRTMNVAVPLIESPYLNPMDDINRRQLTATEYIKR